MLICGRGKGALVTLERFFSYKQK